MLQILSDQVQHAGFKEGVSQRYHQEALHGECLRVAETPYFLHFERARGTQLVLTAHACVLGMGGGGSRSHAIAWPWQSPLPFNCRQHPLLMR
jgi:hypothetical protein